MDHMKILKRAWNILWSYRALWIFGIFLALTGGGGGGNGGGGGGNYNFEGSREYQGVVPWDEINNLPGLLRTLFSSETISTWIGLFTTLLCVLLLIGVLGRILHYVSQVALIRMVDEHERSGAKPGFRAGWRLGWSRSAWRLFLIDLLLYLPVIVVTLVIIALGLLAFFNSGVLESRDPDVASIFGLTAMICCMGLFVFVVSIAISLVQPIIRRYATLENAGVIDSLRGGWALIRRRLSDVVVMWLILVGLTIVYAIVLIPVILMLLAAATLLGGGLGLAAYLAAQAAFSEEVAVLIAILAGMPVFLLILVAPSVFVEGLRQVYGSTVWTLTYRELTAAPMLDALAPAPEMEAGQPDLPPAAPADASAEAS